MFIINNFCLPFCPFSAARYIGVLKRFWGAVKPKPKLAIAVQWLFVAYDTKFIERLIGFK